MGFYNLISASKLTATYDELNRELILYASGDARQFTSGISFEEVPWLGGLKFRLVGWTGPVTGKKQPYEHSQKFKVNLPSPVFPSDYVIIEDADNPNGQQVQIEFIEDGKVPKTLAKTLKAGPDVSNVGNHKNVHALLGVPFEISEGVPTTTGGTVTAHYDNTVLKLVNASYNNGNIVYKFNSLKTGNTDVVLTIGGGIAQYVMQVTYDVEIVVLKKK